MFDINKAPMVRVTWVDARDTETGWLDIKDVLNAHLAICQEVRIKMILQVAVLSPYQKDG